MAISLSVFRARAEARAQALYLGLYRDGAQAFDPLFSEVGADPSAEHLRRIINDELEKLGLPTS